MVRPKSPQHSGNTRRINVLYRYEKAFERMMELVDEKALDKVPRPRLLETTTALLIDDNEWDDFEQVYTEIYLSLKGLPQSRSII